MTARSGPHGRAAWPTDAVRLAAVQEELAAAVPEPWRPPTGELRIGGCWVCFPRGAVGPGAAGNPAWAAAVVLRAGRVVDRAVLAGVATAPYAPGLMALRSGPLLERVVRGLAEPPAVLMLDATGPDHPRGAGLATHLGAVLEVPTVGVTHRPLLASGALPGDERGAQGPLTIAGDTVASWLRTRYAVRPLVVHPGWRVDLATAAELVLATTVYRTPEPLRRARQLARRARVVAEAAPPE